MTTTPAPEPDKLRQTVVLLKSLEAVTFTPSPAHKLRASSSLF